MPSAAPGSEAEPSVLPPLPVVLRAVREARGITRAGWAVRLGYSLKTVQRWERGEVAPDAVAEAALVTLVREEGLLRRYTSGALRGHTLAEGSLRQLLADTRSGKHLPDPPPVLQLVAPPVAVPPPNTLPAALTSFIGREQELAAINALLGTTRLLTLTGPGGTGKTRLSIAAARLVADRFPDGVWFVDLSGVTDPAGVLPAVAQVLDVRESEGCSLAVSLAAYLRRKRLLLMLDNFEQVIAAAMAIYDLLAEAPGLTLLITSRVLLRIESEREYAVPPFPLPDLAAAAVPEQLGANPAVQLFVERAQALRAGFCLSGENAAAVGAICRRLDGLPLAIELAAARMKLLAPVQLLARLDQRLAFLTGGERNRPPRQQTLRAAIQWSWDLLAPAEQVLFRQLGVFAGGWTLAAAEAVCTAGGELDVLDGLAALVDQSLVRQQDDPSGEPRFSLLDTLQEFALEQLEATGEAAALRREHAAYYCTLAKEADAAYWRSGQARQDVLRPLDPERDNLLVALGWALAEQDAAVGLRLGGALGIWFFFRASGEGQRLLERLLGLPEAAVPGAARGRALWSAGNCAIGQTESRAAVAYLEEAAACLRVAEDLPALIHTLGLLAVLLPAAEGDRAQALAEETIRLARAVGGPFDIAWAEEFAGAALREHGGNRTAVRGHFEEARRGARALDADWLAGAALANLGKLAAAEGQHEEARALLHEALPLFEALGDRVEAAECCIGLAQVAATADDQDEAAAQWRRALLAAQESGSATYTVHCLTAIAGLLSTQQRPEQAVRLLAASDGLRQALEQNRYFGSQFQTIFGQALAATEAALSAVAFAQAWAAGQALSLDQATDLALAELASLVSAVNPATDAVL
jgi:predicted ATPase/DNA-binding XRE family transcriptional regulator